jgi:hypothetical protein
MRLYRECIENVQRLYRKCTETAQSMRQRMYRDRSLSSLRATHLAYDKVCEGNTCVVEVVGYSFQAHVSAVNAINQCPCLHRTHAHYERVWAVARVPTACVPKTQVCYDHHPVYSKRKGVVYG